MIARTAALYLAFFVCVLDRAQCRRLCVRGARVRVAARARAGTPEGAAAFGAGDAARRTHDRRNRRAARGIVAIASYLLARAAIAPLEAARERERAFAADAAHELRSPLAGNCSRRAGRTSGRATGDARAAFETIARGALDASAVVADLLTLARDPGRTALQCEPVDLRRSSSRASRDTQPLATSRSVRIDSRAGQRDRRRRRAAAARAGAQLIDNADASRAHAVRSLAPESADSARSSSKTMVTASPPEERERIFQRFYRRANDGTGDGARARDRALDRICARRGDRGLRSSDGRRMFCRNLSRSR